jgi:hypothetical protein
MQTLFLTAALALGVGDPRDGATNATTIDERLPAPSEWSLEWIGLGGEQGACGGRINFDRSGGGTLEINGLEPIRVLSYKLQPLAPHSRIDLRLAFVTPQRPALLPNGKEFFDKLGIYRIRGDRLLLCLGEERPTAFAIAENDGRWFFVFRRVK